MKVLIVKTSSLGDLIHTLPAVTDASVAIPDISFDWVAEEAFAEVPTWHPAVERVIPVAIRRWRKAWIRSWLDGDIKSARQELQWRDYDLIIDAQGLYKSALLAQMARGVPVGLDADSAREPGAVRFYQRGIKVARDRHAIERVRSLFAQALGYAKPETAPDYGISGIHPSDSKNPYLVFLHGTTWITKLWPEEYWAELVGIAASNGFQILLPWGSDAEKLRAERIIDHAGQGELMPRLSLSEMKDKLAGAAGVVGVDSGLAHLAAALSVPAVTLYGPTRTDLTGAIGKLQTNLQAQFACAPCMLKECNYAGSSEVTPACFGDLSPQKVWSALEARIQEVSG
ncbi:MAG: lipopolysaccharide heptosyltransferase I [Gammaproteobacteria bacterium]